jgi:hypothetical protein
LKKITEPLPEVVEVIIEVAEEIFWIPSSVNKLLWVQGRLTSATSEGAQGIFSKITSLKSVHSKEKDEACLGFLVKFFTKSVHRGGVR